MSRATKNANVIDSNETFHDALNITLVMEYTTKEFRFSTKITLTILRMKSHPVDIPRIAIN